MLILAANIGRTLYSPVSLTPVNSFSAVSFTLAISPRIFEKIQNGPNGILMGLGDTDSWKKTELENLVSESPLRATIISIADQVFKIC